MKVRTKPAVKEAIQYFPDEGPWNAIIRMGCKLEQLEEDGMNARIKTLEGTMICSPGDWIIKGLKGEFYPCKPDIFDATYEIVTEQTNDT